MARPLPDETARPARAYLAALVRADEVSDAWHELTADVAYWGDRELLAVLRLAHQVVVQHERISGEVATLALADLGVDDPADVAVVLDTDVDTARRWIAQVVAVRDGEPVPTSTPPTPTEPSPATDDEAPSGVRIGFDEDAPLPGLEALAGRRTLARGVALAILLVAVLLAVTVALLR